MQGVIGVIIVNNQGVPLRSTFEHVSPFAATGLRAFAAFGAVISDTVYTRTQDAMTKQYADLVPGLADLARNLVRDLDPQVRACRGNCR